MSKMTSKVTWVSGLRFIGGSGSGHGAIMDGSQTSSSKEVLGPSPMEMVLMGLGGCSGIDVMHILERMRQTVTGYTSQLYRLILMLKLYPVKLLMSVLVRLHLNLKTK